MTESDAFILLLTANQYIENVSDFWAYIQSGCESTEFGNIVTFGIHPTHPETGYGDILAGSKRPDHSRDIVEFVE